MEGEHSPLFLGNRQMMSTSSSWKQTYTTLTTKSSQESAGLNILEKYDLIKKKNEMLTNNTYAQLFKQTSTTQHRLLSAFDWRKLIFSTLDNTSTTAAKLKVFLKQCPYSVEAGESIFFRKI
jgi:hypothetical protein